MRRNLVLLDLINRIKGLLEGGESRNLGESDFDSGVMCPALTL